MCRIGLDPAKLTAWFDAHGAALLLYARQRLGGAATSVSGEDLVQEAFVRLMGQLSAGREPADVAAYLFTCVRNAATDAARSGLRRRTRERRAGEGGAEWFVPRPEDALDAAEAGRALQRLSPERREVVTLRVWGGMTLAQVAQVTGSPLSTVYDQYRAALAELRQILDPMASRGSEGSPSPTRRVSPL